MCPGKKFKFRLISTLLALVILAVIFAGNLLSPAQASDQRAIGYVELMPNIPQPFAMQTGKKPPGITTPLSLTLTKQANICRLSGWIPLESISTGMVLVCLPTLAIHR